MKLCEILYLYKVFLENHELENFYELLKEEFNKMFDVSSLNIKHDCNVISMSSMNINDANDMQSRKLGDAMFDEDDLFSPPTFDEKIYYDENMPPIYDDYNDESGFEEVMTLDNFDSTILESDKSYCNIDQSGFGDVMTLASIDSTILEDVSIEYDNKVAIYDDYYDDTYAITNNDNHESCHYDFNVKLGHVNQVSHDSYFVEFAPTTINEKKFAHVESNNKFLHVDHEKNALCDNYIVEFIHDATKNYYERGRHGYRYHNNIKFPLFMLKLLKLHLFCLPMLDDSCLNKFFAYKIPMHRKWVRLKCVCFMIHDAPFMFQFLLFM